MNEGTQDFAFDQNFWNDAYKSDADQVIVNDFFLEEETENLLVGTALDVGCGTGLNALMLAAKGWSVVGIDWAPHAIKLAKGAAMAKGLDAHFHVADFTNWGPPHLFDLVYNSFALPEGSGRAKTVRTMSAALRPAGTLIICEWNKKMSKIWGFDEDSLPSPDELAAMLPDLVIESAFTRHVKNAFEEDEMRGKYTSDAFITFIRARKPT